MFDPGLCQIQIDKMTAVPAVRNLAVAFRKKAVLYIVELEDPHFRLPFLHQLRWNIQTIDCMFTSLSIDYLKMC